MKNMPTTFGMQLPWQLYCRVTQINFPPVTKCPVRLWVFLPCARDMQALKYLGVFFEESCLMICLLKVMLINQNLLPSFVQLKAFHLNPSITEGNT